MQRYDSYKDSGVKWLGEIPSHWEVKPIKRIAQTFAGATPNSNNEKYWGGSIAWVTPADFKTETKYVNGGKRFLTELGLNSCSTVIVPRDSVIFSKRAPVGQISIATQPLCTNQGCISCVPFDTVDSTFLYYLLSLYKETFESFSGGTTFKEISQQSFNDFSISLPPLIEQEAIANYLDTATSKIDEAIAQQQKMIDLLNERKQIIINNAVTKGLDPNVKMKPSGVDWIGDIPEHWRLIPIKHIIKFINGYAFDSNEFKSDGDVPVIRISNISEGQVSLDDIAYVSYKKELEPYVTQKGDLLIAMSGATTGKVGFVFERGLYINQRVGAIRSEYQQFVFYWLNSTFFKEYVLLSALGSAQPNISSKGISNFQICLPPKDEIEEICRHIKRELNKLTPSISNITKKISLLQERKQIIINDVVTGKVKVI